MTGRGAFPALNLQRAAGGVGDDGQPGHRVEDRRHHPAEIVAGAALPALHLRPPWLRLIAAQPRRHAEAEEVVGHAGLAVVHHRAVFQPLDDAALAGADAAQREEGRHAQRLVAQHRPGVGVGGAGLEDAAEQVGRRLRRTAPHPPAIDQPVDPEHRRMAAHRRLVDRRREPARRHRRQHADETRPGDVDVGAVRRVMPRDRHVPADVRHWPVEGAQHAVADARRIGGDAGGAGPFVREVEQCATRHADPVGDGEDVVAIGRLAAGKPAPAQALADAQRQPAMMTDAGGQSNRL